MRGKGVRRNGGGIYDTVRGYVEGIMGEIGEG